MTVCTSLESTAGRGASASSTAMSLGCTVKLLRLVKFHSARVEGGNDNDVIMMVHNPKHITWKWLEKMIETATFLLVCYKFQGAQG